MKNLKTVITLILFLTASCTSYEHELNEKNVKKIIKTYEKDNHLSAIVSLKASNDKKEEYNYEKGFINLKGDGFEKESKFPIADLTTQYTAAVLLKVLYQKYEAIHESKDEILKDIKLALDSPISLYLDDNKYWENNKKPSWLNQVTIHQLLTHTSGIADIKNEYNIINVNDKNRFEKICKEFSEKDSLLFEPGSSFHFSRSDYYLISLIIEKLTGKSFAEVIDEQLFSKYQLKSTLNPEGGTVKSLMNKSNYRGVVSQFSYNPFNLSEPYKLNNDFSEYAELQGASSIISNAEDLHAWNFALHKNKIILNEDLYEMMTTKHVNHKGVYYGYGLSFAEVGLKKTFFNVGILDNYTALMVYANDKSLIMLSNLNFDRKEILAQTQRLENTFVPFILNPNVYEISLIKELFAGDSNKSNLVNLISKFSDLLLKKNNS